jgi:hypothetical protein
MSLEIRHQPIIPDLASLKTTYELAIDVAFQTDQNRCGNLETIASLNSA